MDQDSIEVYGNVGTYAFDGNLLSFQLGEQLMNEGSTLVLPAYHNGMPVVHEHQWLGIQGYNVVMRGMNNMLIEEVTQEIKHNRLLPRLYSKEIKMLYGHGHVCYRWVLQDGKMRREYVQLPVVSDWLDSWPDYGLPSAEEFSKANIKNFYYFGDFFCKWRFSRGKQLGIGLPVSDSPCKAVRVVVEAVHEFPRREVAPGEILRPLPRVRVDDVVGEVPVVDNGPRRLV